MSLNKFASKKFNMNDKYKCMFIHIPKTGGSSIGMYFERMRGSHHFIPDVLFNLYPYEFENYFKLTSVRNPYDGFVSQFFFMMNIRIKKYRDINFEHYKKYNEDIKRFATEQRFLLKDIFDIEEYKLFWPQIKWLYFKNGNKVNYDYICKIETLDDDMINIIGQYFNINKYKVERFMVTPHKYYEEYYDLELKEMVYEIYKDDFIYLENELGYKFNHK